MFDSRALGFRDPPNGSSSTLFRLPVQQLTIIQPSICKILSAGGVHSTSAVVFSSSNSEPSPNGLHPRCVLGANPSSQTVIVAADGGCAARRTITCVEDYATNGHRVPYAAYGAMAVTYGQMQGRIYGS